jgi:GTP:adenosylcobinamide-phosphate guanylyltransferase
MDRIEANDDSGKKWTVLLLAGQRPGVDALAAHFGETYKALIPVADVPMLTRVLETLHTCPEVARIVVLAQEQDPLADAIKAGGGADFFASSGGISSSIAAFLNQREAPFPILVTTADHPLLTPAMVAEFTAKASGDLSIGMVSRKNMLDNFPDAQRTWLKMRDDGWSGTNLFALQSDAVHAALTLWAEAEQDRKKVFKLFLRFGPWLAIRAILRTVTMADALRLAGRKLGLSANLIAMSDPIAAIDVDKVSDHVQAEAILRARINNHRANPTD